MGGLHGDGDLQLVFNVGVGKPEAARASELLAGPLGNMTALRLDPGYMDSFFARYANVGGDMYHASWNDSQTLGWQGEANGLGVILSDLKRLCGECWAYSGAKGLPGCSAAVPFDP